MEIKTKFDIDQEIFYMEKNKVKTADINKINIETKNNHYFKVANTITYRARNQWECSSKEFRESNIYWTKQELLDSL